MPSMVGGCVTRSARMTGRVEPAVLFCANAAGAWMSTMSRDIRARCLAVTMRVRRRGSMPGWQGPPFSTAEYRGPSQWLRAGRWLFRIRRPLEQIARLTLQLTAERVERGKTDGPGLVGLEDRQVRERDADARGDVGERDATIEQKVIELDADGHGVQIVSD